MLKIWAILFFLNSFIWAYNYLGQDGVHYVSDARILTPPGTLNIGVFSLFKPFNQVKEGVLERGSGVKENTNSEYNPLSSYAFSLRYVVSKYWSVASLFDLRHESSGFLSSRDNNKKTGGLGLGNPELNVKLHFLLQHKAHFLSANVSLLLPGVFTNNAFYASDLISVTDKDNIESFGFSPNVYGLHLENSYSVILSPTWFLYLNIGARGFFSFDVEGVGFFRSALQYFRSKVWSISLLARHDFRFTRFFSTSEIWQLGFNTEYFYQSYVRISGGIDFNLASEFDIVYNRTENPVEAIKGIQVRSVVDVYLGVHWDFFTGNSKKVTKKKSNTKPKLVKKIFTTPKLKDTDGDGIPDNLDNCIDEKETFNGISDLDGCPDKKESTENQLLYRLTFEVGSNKLGKAEKLKLKELAKVIFKDKDSKFLVEGHSDNLGRASLNSIISLKRAISVVKYLSSLGIPKARFTFKGIGPSKPVADNKTAKGRAENRRVEIRYAK